MFKCSKIGRAQIALYDCMFAIFIFVIIFWALMVANNRNYETGENIIKSNEMRDLAHNAIETLVGFEGKPAEWNTQNVQVIGLAESGGALSREKAQELQKMDYEKIKALLIFGKYNFLLQIDSKNDADDLSLGQDTADKNTVIKIERNVLYGGAIANVKLSLFE